MKRSTVHRLTAMCIAGAALTASTTASAQHYYAVDVASPFNGSDADDGVQAQLWTNDLHSTCNLFQHDFVNHELWYDTSSTGAYWVEVGWKDGTDASGTCHTQTLFWADSRPGGGYAEHFTGYTLNAGAWDTFQVSTAGSCSWSVYANTINIGTSTVNCPGSGRFAATGIESTSQTTGNADGWAGNWWEQNNLGTWTNWWDNGTTCQTSGNPATWIPCGPGIGNPRIQWESGIGTEEVLNENFAE
jgi:hypothetical protein